MTERPILFSAPMVQAILDGRKTMTRRVLPGNPNRIRTIGYIYKGWTGLEDERGRPIKKPYIVGNRLWVKESHRFIDSEDKCDATMIGLKCNNRYSPSLPV